MKRLDCLAIARPCTRTHCRMHLASPLASCALDAIDAARGPLTLEEVGTLLGLTRERVRQIQEEALAKLAPLLDRDLLAAWAHAPSPVIEDDVRDVYSDAFRRLVARAYFRVFPRHDWKRANFAGQKRGRA